MNEHRCTLQTPEKLSVHFSKVDAQKPTGSLDLLPLIMQCCIWAASQAKIGIIVCMVDAHITLMCNTLALVSIVHVFNADSKSCWQRANSAREEESSFEVHHSQAQAL